MNVTDDCFEYQQGLTGYAVFYVPGKTGDCAEYVLNTEDVQFAMWITYRLNAWLKMLDIERHLFEYVNATYTDDAKQDPKALLNDLIDVLDDQLDSEPSAPYNLFHSVSAIFSLEPRDYGHEFMCYAGRKRRSLTVLHYDADPLWLGYRVNAFWMLRKWRNLIATGLASGQEPALVVKWIYNEHIAPTIGGAPSYRTEAQA